MAVSYYVRSLQLEMTRRCNANCLICMRGDAQNIDMHPNIIKNIFENDDHTLSSVTEIFLTGGEPFLNKEGILTLFDFILTYSIPVKQIAAITNGLICDKEILMFAKKLYEMGISINFETHMDQFHPTIPPENRKFFESLEFFHIYEKKLKNSDILQMGRALENHLGSKFFTHFSIQNFRKEATGSLEVRRGQENNIFIPGIYITSDGRFGSPYGDATWQMIDRTYQLNILQHSLFTHCRFDSEKSKMMIKKEFLPILLETERFKEDYLWAQKNNFSSIFLNALDEERIRDYLENQSIRKRSLHF